MVLLLKMVRKKPRFKEMITLFNSFEVYCFDLNDLTLTRSKDTASALPIVNIPKDFNFFENRESLGSGIVIKDLRLL